MNISEVLRDLAAKYFDPESGGDAAMLVDEFNTTPEFVRGQYRGHQDAHSVLLGLADHFESVQAEERL